MSTATTTMPGVILPGNSTVEFKESPIPEPGHGQVLVRMKASSICGSDIRAIYREHLGKGPGGLSGGDRRPRAVRADRQGRAGLQAVQGGRPGGDLPHLRLRRLRRVPARLYDQLPQQLPGRVRLAARRRPRPLPAGRGEHLHPPARFALLHRRRPLRLRLRHGLRGPAADAGERAGPPADHRAGAGGPGRGHARPGARGHDDHRHRPLGEAAGAGQRPGTGRCSPSRPTTTPSARS